MSHIKLYTGCQGDTTQIDIAWHDHNNIRYVDSIRARVLQADKPRTIEITINDQVVAWLRPGSTPTLRLMTGALLLQQVDSAVLIDELRRRRITVPEVSA